MKYGLLFLFLGLASCSHYSGEDESAESYGNYSKIRKEASALCDQLGFLPGSPDFYSCVGTQHTRLKAAKAIDKY